MEYDHSNPAHRARVTEMAMRLAVGLWNLGLAVAVGVIVWLMA